MRYCFSFSKQLRYITSKDRFKKRKKQADPDFVPGSAGETSGEEEEDSDVSMPAESTGAPPVTKTKAPKTKSYADLYKAESGGPMRAKFRCPLCNSGKPLTVVQKHLIDKHRACFGAGGSQAQPTEQQVKGVDAAYKRIRCAFYKRRDPFPTETAARFFDNCPIASRHVFDIPEFSKAG